MSFAPLGLSDPLLRALNELSYDTATPIQEKAIPLVLQGGDLLAAAQTGSGKTAAFVLPILQRFSEPKDSSRGGPSLILVPTRELAIQVGDSIERYGKDLVQQPKTLVVFGGAAIDPQIKKARGGADIVVATPGRLLDLIERQVLSLSEIKLLVLDEADRLLALGFADELNAILDLLPSDRQNLLFSATFPAPVVKMADALLKDPEKVQMETESRPVESIVQRAIEVEKNDRTALLRHLLEVEDWSRVLVFVASKRRASNVTAKLAKKGIKVAVLHGDLKQAQRTHALESFKKSKTRVLMATDLAARGIDIPELPCVVNYDLPRSPADYVHRIGRTGRAGKSGVAVSFISQEEHRHFKLIEKRYGMNLERERIEGFIPTEWDPDAIAVPMAPVKGKRKSKKNRLRDTVNKGKRSEESKEPNETPDAPDPWANALKKAKRSS